MPGPRSIPEARPPLTGSATARDLKILFAGTSSFAVPALRALATSGSRVGAVITRPDRPAGRGRRPLPSPVRRAAAELGLDVRTPERINAAAEITALSALAPDLMVVAAYGQILKPAVLALPRLGCVNVHASLLPRWRGAAPVAHALLAGDRVTGITLMRMDAGLDTGPILAQASTPVADEDDRGSLTARLARLGADLLLESLPRIGTGSLRELLQDDRRATQAPRLQKADGRLDWNRPAVELWRRIRAFTPEPGAFTFRDARRLLVRRSRPGARGDSVPDGPPGTIGPPQRGAEVPIRCGDGTALILLRVQPEGRPEMDAAAAARGRHLPAGSVLCYHPRPS